LIIKTVRLLIQGGSWGPKTKEVKLEKKKMKPMFKGKVECLSPVTELRVVIEEGGKTVGNVN